MRGWYCFICTELYFNTVEHRLGLIKILVNILENTKLWWDSVMWAWSVLEKIRPGLGWKPPLPKPSISAKHTWVFIFQSRKKARRHGVYAINCESLDTSLTYSFQDTCWSQMEKINSWHGNLTETPKAVNMSHGVRSTWRNALSLHGYFGTIWKLWPESIIKKC